MITLKKGLLLTGLYILFSAFCWAVEEGSTSAPAPAAPPAPVAPAVPPNSTPVAEKPAVSEAVPAAKTVETPKFPYIAEIVGSEVYLRSGPGTAYYHCGKLNAPQRVTIVNFSANNWFQIIPPAGSFSWISKSFVKTDPVQPKKGIVSDDAVRVWAGSDFVEPMRSSSLQVKLNKGAVVEIIGDPAGEGDYYKITPPEGAFLWVSGDCLKALEPAKEEPKKELTKPEEKTDVKTNNPEITLAEVTEPVKKEEPKPAEPLKAGKESVYLKQCYELAAKLDEEVKKPAPQQNYTDYKKPLEDIVADKEQAGIAEKYATYLLERISRYEIAIAAGEQLKQQDKRLDDIRKQIDEARKAQIEKISVLHEKFVMTGTLKPSYVYSGKTGQKRYLLTNEQGRIIAYVSVSDESMQSKADGFLNKKVGVSGQMINSPKDLITLIMASNIELLP